MKKGKNFLLAILATQLIIPNSAYLANNTMFKVLEPKILNNQELLIAPKIDSLSSNIARVEGGQEIIVTGQNFSADTQVILADRIIKDFRLESSTQIVFKVPSGIITGGRTLSILNKDGLSQVQFNIIPKPLSELKEGEITSIIGGLSYIGDGFNALSERVLLEPLDVAVDANGNLFVADLRNQRIRKVDAQTGIITTIAGNGEFAFFGDGENAIAASLANPVAVALDSKGNLFIADANNNSIRKVDVQTGVITTVAGIGEIGVGADGVLATSCSLNSPRGIILDNNGNLFIADSQNNRVRKVDAQTGIITTIAGTGRFGFSGDGGAAKDATLNFPYSLAFDNQNNLLIVDSQNNRVRKVDAQTGIITTIAGTGEGNFSGDGALAKDAKLNQPSAIVKDNRGNLFIADSGNQRIRKIDTQGIITTIAGSNLEGSDGDGGPAKDATLVFPSGLAIDKNDNLFIADSHTRKIRRIDAQTGIITAVAGNKQVDFTKAGDPPTSVILSGPTGLTVDSKDNIFFGDTSSRIGKLDPNTNMVTTVAGIGEYAFLGDGGLATKAGIANQPRLASSSGNLFISDGGNQRIRRVDMATGVINTIVGVGRSGGSTSDGILGSRARLDFPEGITLDSKGNLFITDRTNRIRKVDAQTGIITTVAGTGEAGFSGDGAQATQAKLSFPTAVTVDSKGNIFFSDSFNNRIRRVDAQTGIIRTVTGTGEAGFSGDGDLASKAKISFPNGLTLNSRGDLFFVDDGNNVIRKIDAITNIITTVAGTGKTGFDGDGGKATLAKFAVSREIALDSKGNIYFTDLFNDRIRVVKGSITARVDEPNSDAPVVSFAILNKPSLFLEGLRFSTSAKVSINQMDISNHITKQSETSITLVGNKKKLNLKSGENNITVTVNGKESNKYLLKLP
ncbi:MAG: SMP-30/gluconolactonase/LRE family protein [Acidobacteria bacterium]|nr:SMP-30/gluconolactonase/LRE family protein [Acidobacteriota bacterium]